MSKYASGLPVVLFMYDTISSMNMMLLVDKS